MRMEAIVYEDLCTEQLTEGGCFIWQNWGIPAEESLSIAWARVELEFREI